MIPGFNFIDFAHTAGPWAALILVMVIIFAESGLLIGFFLPGDSLLFTLGFLIQTPSTAHLNLNLAFVILMLFIAAVLGDSVGYAFGHRVGPHIFTRQNSLLFKQENIEKAQAFYERYGGKTIIMARFIPVVRTFAPVVAGAARMTYKNFIIFNLIGGLLWAAGVTLLGYFLGALLHSIGIDIDTVLLPIIALIIIVSIAPALYHLLKDKQQREILWNATKTQCRRLFTFNK